jgi:hypothetical protein
MGCRGKIPAPSTAARTPTHARHYALHITHALRPHPPARRCVYWLLQVAHLRHPEAEGAKDAAVLELLDVAFVHAGLAWGVRGLGDGIGCGWLVLVLVCAA